MCTETTIGLDDTFTFDTLGIYPCNLDGRLFMGFWVELFLELFAEA
jgi:hypothetical protein